MWKELGHFIHDHVGKFVHWFSLIFADDEYHRLNPSAPTMKNVVMFVLLCIFASGFLKTVYLMQVVVQHEVHANVAVKSIADSLQVVQPQSMPTYTFSIPDIPQGWQYVLLAGMGILAALNGTKHIASLKYGNGNGNGGDDKSPPDKEQDK